jgi:uncharacterized membrane protein
MTRLLTWVNLAWRALYGNSRWMAWNLFLAFVPLALSVWLFRKAQRSKAGQRPSRSFVWWVGLVVFIAFLPNAPYVLTDIIHLVSDIRAQSSIWVITLVLIPQYLLFIGAGFEAYVLSLINLGYYLNQQGWSKWVIWVELLIHGLSAIGIYLGRFLRFNSWDLITQFDTIAGSVVDEAARRRPLIVIAITFVVITGLYWLMKQVSLALAAYRQNSKAGPSKA